MTTIELLSQLRSLGIAIWLDGDEIRYRATPGVLPLSLLSEMRSHKADLVAFLRTAGAERPKDLLIPPVPRTGPMPLSFAQDRLWFLEELEPGTAAYNIAAALPLSFTVDIGALKRSLDFIVERHESLRTAFTTIDSHPVQIISPDAHVTVNVIDLRHMDQRERSIEAQRLANEEAGQPLDLSTAPLLRATVVQLGESESLLLLTMHHIVSDGWSMGIFYRELGLVYGALAAGARPQLPMMRIQYADFAVWQRNWLVGNVLRDEVAFWQEHLADAPMLQLPTDRQRPSFQTFSGAACDIRLSRKLTESLLSVARRERCTLFMVLFAGYAAVLSRHSGQRDIVIGTYNAGRNRNDTEQLIGFFINTLAVRVRIDPSMSFRDLLHHVRDVTLAVFDHQDLPFPKLIKELNLERDLSRNPLFQTVLHLFNAPTFPQPDSTPVQEYGRPTESASFDLVMNFMEGPEGLFGQAEYNTDLFDESTIERLIAHLTIVLERGAEAPDRRISALTMLSDDDRRATLSIGQGPAIALDETTTLVDRFEARVSESGNAVAFCMPDGERLTYRELHSRAHRIAARLRRYQLVPEARIAIHLDPSFELPAAVIAVLLVNGVYLPLDPAAPTARLNLIVDDAAPAVIITDRLASAKFDLPADQVLLIDDDPGELDAPIDDGPPPAGAHPSAVAYVLYTSGSTGTPKGVEIEHRQILNRLNWMWRCYPFDDDELSCLKTSVGFVDSIWELFGPLLAGSPTLIAHADIARDPDALVTALAQHGVTRIWLVPSLLRVLLDGYPDLRQRLPRLTFWVTSGEELSGELAQRFLVQLHGAKLYNLYGTSEVWDATWCPIEDLAEQSPVPIGRPIDNVSAYVLDDELQLVPTGVVGELYIGGIGLARGYIGKPKLTATAFVGDPFNGTANGRLYRTGDLVRWRADGQLQFVGRRDQQVQIRGLRVELGELEALLQSHPAVADAAVVAIRKGNDETLLIGYVSLTAEALDDETVELVSDHLQNWQEIWDETYRPASSDRVDPSGFVSSFTGQPLAAEDIDDWLNNAVESVRSLPHRRVLEIGCGNGALLARIAPECDAYVASDFSAKAVELLTAEVTRNDDLACVTVHHRAADEFDELPTESFDVTVLHSVVQYFPSVEYLERVLAGAIACTSDGGTVLVGDVPCLGLLKDFHRAVEDYRSPGASADALERRVLSRIMHEKELWLDPRLFKALAGTGGRVTAVEIRPKRGQFRNEFTTYRYDVALRVGAVDRAPTQEIAWRKLASIDALGEYLRGARCEVTVVGVPNSRLAAKAEIETFDPADVNRLEAEVGGSIELRWSTKSHPGDLDLRFRPNGLLEDTENAPSATPMPLASQQIRRFGNNPIRYIRAQAVMPELRRFLAEKVPDQMIPGQLVIMPALPLTSSGKVDRVSLRTMHVIPLKRVHIPAQTAAEEVACAIWANVLGVDRVGVRDDFFADLGGHSLLAIQAVSRLRDIWRISIPLRLMFELPTVAGLLSTLCDEPQVRRVVQRTSELYLEVLQLSSSQVAGRLAEDDHPGEIVDIEQIGREP